jgi:prepilin-type N-terminal cleavage/methylation domain-containing protein
MTIRDTRQEGFTLIEIMIVVSVIGLLAAIAIPNFVRARSYSQTNACINNLRQIDGAMQQWALEQNKAAAASVDYADISAYMKRAVVCPAGGAHASFTSTYNIVDAQTRPLCTVVSSTHILPN